MKLRQAWKKAAKRREMARFYQRKADEGCSLLVVPGWLAAEAQQWIWVRKVARAGEKWDKRVAEVTPEAWKQAMYRHLPRQEGGDD